MGFWKGKKVLITGGAGFIGSNLTERLVKLGAWVRIVDNLERGSLDNLGSILKDVEFRRQDLKNIDVCLDACKNIEIVFHLASKVGSMKYYVTRPAEVLSQTLLVDTNMLQTVERCAIGRYFYASSSHVYPIELQLEPNAPPLKEEQALPANPAVSYGWAKLIAEKQIEYGIVQGYSTRMAIGRIMGAYGKNQDISLERGSSIPVFIRRAIEYPETKPFIVLGTGQETRSYCYVDDVIDAMISCIEKLDNNQLIGPINIGSDERISIRDLVEEVIHISGKDITPVYKAYKTEVWGQSVDCFKAREVLNGWHSKITLKEGLRNSYLHIKERIT